MGLIWILLGSSLCTTVVLYTELSRRDTLTGVVFIVLVMVLVKEQFSEKWWYPALFEAWIGVTFLLANWLRISEGRDSVPVYITFGPTFLLIGLFKILRHFVVQRSTSSPQN